VLSPEKSQLFPFIKMGLENKNDTRMQIYLTEWRETFFRWKIVFCCNEISLKELSKYTYSHLTWENWGKWLQGIKRTFQPARLNCIRQELEHTILGHKKEDNISPRLSSVCFLRRLHVFAFKLVAAVTCRANLALHVILMRCFFLCCKSKHH